MEKISNKRLTTEQFIEKSIKIHSNKYDYSKSNYVNNRTVLEIICPIHGLFLQRPQSHFKNGHGCPKCGVISGQNNMSKSYFEFKTLFKQQYQNHDLVQPKTFSDNFKFTFICGYHGEFKSTPKLIRQSWCCPSCAKNIIPTRYLSILKLQYPQFDYCDSIFINRDSYIEAKCNLHGHFSVHFRRHIKGLIGCNGCVNSGFIPKIVENNLNNRINNQNEKRLQLFRSLFHDSLEYLKFEDGKVYYYCSFHGPQSSLWVNMRKGKGCKKCADELHRINYQNNPESVILKFNEIHKNKYDYTKSVYKSYGHKIIIVCPTHGEFEQLPSAHLNGHGCLKCQISNVHLNFNTILDNLNISYNINDREILKPFEIDTYVSSRRVGFEINGVYWHSYSNMEVIDRDRHLNKLKHAINNNINLIQFTDYEILNQNKIVTSMVQSRLGFSNRIYARNTKIQSISSELSDVFLVDNHLKGAGNPSVRIGLNFNDELVSLMTFSRSFNTNAWKIDRFATKLGYVVVGGASKILNYFKLNHKPTSILTYADCRYSTGNVYESIGMTRLSTRTIPGYQYVKGNKLFSRQKFQKHKLVSLYESGFLKFFDHGLTELENMLANGYRVLYDCGNYKFIWNEND